VKGVALRFREQSLCVLTDDEQSSDANNGLEMTRVAPAHYATRPMQVHHGRSLFFGLVNFMGTKPVSLKRAREQTTVLRSEEIYNHLIKQPSL
jgi:hypothetical protein